MPVLVLDLLKYLFLAVLYIFVARAIRAIYVELKPSALQSRPAPKKSGKAKMRSSKKTPARAVVVEGDTMKGKVFPLGDEFIVGRADKCHLILEDNYVSQVHARIFAKGESFMVEDLGSTNGTYLNRQSIDAPTELRRGDRVKIGKTVLEMRK